jgi:hypothetical protein
VFWKKTIIEKNRVGNRELSNISQFQFPIIIFRSIETFENTYQFSHFLIAPFAYYFLFIPDMQRGGALAYFLYFKFEF